MSIDSLKHVVLQFEMHSESVQTSLGKLPAQLGSIEAKLMQNAPSNLPTELALPIRVDMEANELAKSVLKRVSAYGGIYIYAASVCFKRKIPVDLIAITNMTGGPVDYFYGIAIGLSSANIIPAKKNSTPSNLIISDMPDYFTTLTRKDMKEWTEKYKSPMKEKLVSWIDGIDNNFELSPDSTEKNNSD